MTAEREVAPPARVALVSRAAVTENITTLADEAPGCSVLVDLPSDAYGHGVVDAGVTAVAAGASALAVTRLADAVALRRAGVAGELIVSRDALDDGAAEVAGLLVGANVLSVVDVERAAALGASSVWIDLGSRPGGDALAESELIPVIDRLVAGRRGSERFRVGVSGSDSDQVAAVLGRASERGLVIDDVAVSIDSVDSRLEPIPAVDGVTRFIRLGAQAFGLSETRSHARIGTRPALSLRAPVVSLKQVDAGVGVSYGYTYRTSSPSRLALVPLGYGDGVDRSLGNRARVLLRGNHYTIAGRVAMDACVLDVGDADVTVGDMAELLGDPATGVPEAGEWADLLGVPSAVVVAGLTARVERRWV